MPKLPRDANYRKYNISKNRFRELYYYALQYQEWKDELRYKYDTAKAITYSDMPKAPQNGAGDPTFEAAARCSDLQHKIDTIEKSARLADEQLYPYILKAVTNEGITYNYLYMHCGIPCGSNTFYDRRRRFYWILDKNLE